MPEGKCNSKRKFLFLLPVGTSAYSWSINRTLMGECLDRTIGVAVYPRSSKDEGEGSD